MVIFFLEFIVTSKGKEIKVYIEVAPFQKITTKIVKDARENTLEAGMIICFEVNSL